MTGTVACGGDDDDDGNNGGIDAAAGGIDAAAGGIDANLPPDADVTPDAGLPGDPAGTFLLSVSIASVNVTVRTFTTVTTSKDGTTADFTIEALGSPACENVEDGARLGNPLTVTGLPVVNPFLIPETQGTFPAGSISLSCNMDNAGAIETNGTILPDGTTCGTVNVTALGLTVAGTFGSVRIDPETPPADLPDPVTTCP